MLKKAFPVIPEGNMELQEWRESIRNMKKSIDYFPPLKFSKIYVTVERGFQDM